MYGSLLLMMVIDQEERSGEPQAEKGEDISMPLELSTNLDNTLVWGPPLSV